MMRQALTQILADLECSDNFFTNINSKFFKFIITMIMIFIIKDSQSKNSIKLAKPLQFPHFYSEMKRFFHVDCGG